MLVDPTLEELLPHTKNRFDLSIVIAKRNRELIAGAKPLVDEKGIDSYNSLASFELAADKIATVPEDVDADVPLREELIEARLAAEKEKAEEEEFVSQNDEEEEAPNPETKIQVMDEEDMFYMPYEKDESDEDEQEKPEKDADLDDYDDEEDDEEEFSDEYISEEDEEEYASNEDLENIDSSIDDVDEEDELLSEYEDLDD